MTTRWRGGGGAAAALNLNLRGRERAERGRERAEAPFLQLTFRVLLLPQRANMGTPFGSSDEVTSGGSYHFPPF